MDFPAKDNLANDVAGGDVAPRVESSFRCPVCRAGQPLQERCRRCRADLSLVVLARQRVNYLLMSLDGAAGHDASQRQRFQSELKLLSPGSLPSG